MIRLATPNEVVDAGLCTGCGLCASSMPDGVAMHVSGDGYLRPGQQRELTRRESSSFAATCPGIRVDGALRPPAPDVSPHWGPIRGVYEAWAADPEVRLQGSSGGVLTALGQFLLATGQVASVLHVGASDTDPFGTALYGSKDGAEVASRAGSRYAPSSPLQDLHRRLERGELFAVIAKPCDLVGLANLSSRDERVARLVPLRLSFFCAGIPSRDGSRALAGAVGASPDDVERIVYRGDGWPGATQVHLRRDEVRTLTYARAWGDVLGPTLQFRCKVCPDGTGEFADLSCGDSWTVGEDGPTFDEAPGRSLVVVRSDRGARLFADAVSEGWVVVGRALSTASIGATQPSQLLRKRSVAWRVAGLEVGRRAPSFQGMGLLRAARELGLGRGVRAGVGTFRRRPRAGRGGAS